MAGGYINMGGNKMPTLIGNITDITFSVVSKYGIYKNQINCQLVNKLKDGYAFQIIFKIPEERFMMLKMTGQLDVIINDINSIYRILQ